MSKSKENHRYVVAFLCVDCRLHKNAIHLNDYLCNKFDADGVFEISIPGPDGDIAHGDDIAIKYLRRCLDKLVKAKDPFCVIIMGHTDCAGHVVSDAAHRSDVAKSVKVIESWGYKGRILGLLAVLGEDDGWDFEEVS